MKTVIVFCAMDHVPGTSADVHQYLKYYFVKNVGQDVAIKVCENLLTAICIICENTKKNLKFNGSYDPMPQTNNSLFWV
jgi:hypothetical protein